MLFALPLFFVTKYHNLNEKKTNHPSNDVKPYFALYYQGFAMLVLGTAETLSILVFSTAGGLSSSSLLICSRGLQGALRMRTALLSPP